MTSGSSFNLHFNNKVIYFHCSFSNNSNNSTQSFWFCTHTQQPELLIRTLISSSLTLLIHLSQYRYVYVCLCTCLCPQHNTNSMSIITDSRSCLHNKHFLSVVACDSLSHLVQFTHTCTNKYQIKTKTT